MKAAVLNDSYRDAMVSIDSICSCYQDMFRVRQPSHIVNELKYILDNYIDNSIEHVKDFFRDKTVVDVINYIYKSENTKYKHNIVNVIDINMAKSLYDEYFGGLCEFVELCETIKKDDIVSDGIQISSILDKIQNSFVKDKEYIDSIFGGKLNSAAEENIYDAMSQLEYLITYIKGIKNTIKCVDRLFLPEFKTDENDINHLKVLAVTLFVKSLIDYSENVIMNTMTLFKAIVSEDKLTKPDTSMKIFY